MCYSAEVSAGTFLFVSAVTTYLWIRNKGIDRALAGILFFIGFMQAIEWGLWTNLDCNSVNKGLAFSIPIYLALQPVVINLLVWFYKAGWASGYEWVGLFSLAYTGIVIWKNRNDYGSCVTLDTNKNLIWPGVANQDFEDQLLRSVYYATMLYPLLTLKNSWFSATYTLFGAVSLWMFGETSSKSWPSLWCHFVNALAVLAIIRPAP